MSSVGCGLYQGLNSKPGLGADSFTGDVFTGALLCALPGWAPSPSLSPASGSGPDSHVTSMGSVSFLLWMWLSPKCSPDSAGHRKRPRSSWSEAQTHTREGGACGDLKSEGEMRGQVSPAPSLYQSAMAPVRDDKPVSNSGHTTVRMYFLLDCRVHGAGLGPGRGLADQHWAPLGLALGQDPSPRSIFQALACPCRETLFCSK